MTVCTARLCMTILPTGRRRCAFHRKRTWTLPVPRHRKCRDCAEPHCATCIDSTWPCPVGRCGVLLPRVKEPCARYQGHRGEHRSRYAMDNAVWAQRNGWDREAAA